jgi:hypothetical protein
MHVKIARYILFAGVGMVVGFAIGWVVSAVHFETRVDRIVAMSWGGGRYGPAFYGAEVYLVPITSGYSVRARVHIGRGNDLFHDCGQLGTVQTDSEAVARWGHIEWAADGLHIGTGTNIYFMPRGKLETHR